MDFAELKFVIIRTLVKWRQRPLNFERLGLYLGE